MVRLINDKNMDVICSAVYKILRIQEHFTHIANYNYPKEKSCIFAMWHANQFLVHGLENRKDTSILISNSIDGEIVARATEKWGFHVIRGSAGKKGAVESTMQMIKRLNEDKSVAIMIDGPHGPLHKVKNGVIKLAQKSGKPIVPVHWYSPQKTFIKLPSWDSMTTPLGYCKILNIYGEPIYINDNATEEEISNTKDLIKNSLYYLEASATRLYKEALEKDLWKKQQINS